MNTIGAITTLIESLSDEQIKSLLVGAIRMLEARGLATPDDYVTLGLLGEMPGHSVNTHEVVETEKGQSMDTAIQMFKFENKQEIRVVEGNDGEPWFVATDICGALGLSNAAEAISALEPDEKNTIRISDGINRPGNPNRIGVSESGMYALVFRSNKPEAKRFRKWVTSEVLPSIRKHGSYFVPGRQPSDIEMFEMSLNIMKQMRSDITDLQQAEAARRKNEVRTLAAGLSVDSSEYYPITAYANIIGRRVSINKANWLGRKATKWSKDNGYSIGQISDTRFGRVNTYHIDALEYAFGIDG
jgi:prophage antirepressor-like protein